jgi:hypothetical protein
MPVLCRLGVAASLAALMATRSFCFASSILVLLAACGSSSKPGVITGAAGTSGAAGSGTAGATGVAGTSGAAGTTGAAGTSGAAGSTGAAGSSGAAGTSGAAGLTGAAGQTGAAGATGAAGTNGASGSDAGAPTDGPTATAIKGHPAAGMAYPTYPGFTLYLVEEFDAPIDLNADPLWTWGDGTINDGQARFGEEAITFSEGKMKITVSKGDTPAGLSIVKSGVAPGAMVGAKTLKSGELRSKHNMFRFGRYEASIKGPPVDGNYILSFFGFRTPHFEEWREIDFELLGSLPKSVSTNIIIGMNMENWSPTAEEPASVFPFGAQPAMALPATFDARGGFHTYAFEALPDHVTFFVDGVPIRTKLDKVGQNKLIVPERSFKIMFNHWVFNNTGFGGDPAKNTYPFTGEYDWFRFYRWNQDAKYPCEPLPSCLPADDRNLSANNPKETP